jgi:hypothetical protein
VTEAGQLTATSPEELASAIDADSFLYGDIVEAQRVMIGIYAKKKVRIAFKILDRGGQVMWEDERVSMAQQVTLSPAAILLQSAASLAKEVGNDVIMKLLKSHPLFIHLRNVCDWSSSTLPAPR